MRIEFAEDLDVPVEQVYSFFRTPEDWPRLYGAFGDVEDRGDGWKAVPLKHFPFPLVARITRDEPLRCVRWEFAGFWRGEGEVNFQATPRGVRVEGYEQISVGPLSVLSRVVERLFLEQKFRAVWKAGWRRLRRRRA